MEISRHIVRYEPLAALYLHAVCMTAVFACGLHDSCICMNANVSLGAKMVSHETK